MLATVYVIILTITDLFYLNKANETYTMKYFRELIKFNSTC